jgi:hypothetical protein
MKMLPLFLTLALPGMAAVTLQVPVTDFSLNARTNVGVTLQRIPPAGVAAGSFVSAGPQTRRTDTDGNAWFTNIVAGTYRLTINDGPPRVYQIAVGTNDTGTINAVDRVTVWPPPQLP